ncbi:MAG: ATPase P [Butyricicoccus sp.]|jgi:hypothetical protein
MYWKPTALSEQIAPDELRADKQNCKVFGPCGVGQKALYLSSRFLDRRFYVPAGQVRRAYKRVAMSKGGFTGKGVFGSIPYLVVEFDEQTVQCTFKYENQLDAMLAEIRTRFPRIKTVSAAAEKRLARAEAERKSRRKSRLTEQDRQTIAVLEQARGYLQKRSELSERLSAAYKAKRVYQNTNPAYRWTAIVICLFGLAAAVYGAFALITHTGEFGLYFLLFGLAALLLFSGVSVLPTAKRNRRAIDMELEETKTEMEWYLKEYPDFPIPARYAHPACLTRMIRSVEEGRADSVEQAYQDLKDGLKALNSDVQVSQEEYDEVVAIKPMFLIEEYR